MYPSSEDISAVGNSRSSSSSPFAKRIRLLLNGDESCGILMMLLLLPTGHHQRLTSLIECRSRRRITICHLLLSLLQNPEEHLGKDNTKRPSSTASTESTDLFSSLNNFFLREREGGIVYIYSGLC